MTKQITARTTMGSTCTSTSRIRQVCCSVESRRRRRRRRRSDLIAPLGRPVRVDCSARRNSMKPTSSNSTRTRSTTTTTTFLVASLVALCCWSNKDGTVTPSRSCVTCAYSTIPTAVSSTPTTRIRQQRTDDTNRPHRQQKTTTKTATKSTSRQRSPNDADDDDDEKEEEEEETDVEEEETDEEESEDDTEEEDDDDDDDVSDTDADTEEVEDETEEEEEDTAGDEEDSDEDQDNASTDDDAVVDGGSAAEEAEAEEDSDDKETASTAVETSGSDDTASGESTTKVKQQTDQTKTSSPPSPQSFLPRPRPPNALYRFLLRQGRIGHVIVMVLVLLSELIALYIPPLAKVLGAILARIFPTPSEPPPGRRRRPPPGSASDLLAAATTASRTGQSKRQKRALTKQADRVALQQLQRLGSVEDAKYRYVSASFLRRHRLGPYATASSTTMTVRVPGEQQIDQDLVGFGSDETSATNAALISRDKTKRRKGKVLPAVAEDSESDGGADWVLAALTQPAATASIKTRRSRRRPVVQPTVSIGVGSRGSSSISVGFEIGGDSSSSAGISNADRRRSALEAALSADAAARRRLPQKKQAGPRSSDRDGGDGIFGRIRAAAGTDSRLSRSLLGAYPGDAVPPSEAANPEGVLELAERYGWGDWSEESDEDDDNKSDSDRFVLPRTRKVRRRRKASEQRRRSSVSVGFDLDAESGTLTRARKRPTTAAASSAAFGQTSGETTLENRDAAASRRSQHMHRFRKAAREAPLASSSTLGKRVSLGTSAEKVNVVRPAKETRGNKDRNGPLSTSPTLAKSSLASSNRQVSARAQVSRVRPSMEALIERRDLLHAKKRHNDED